jgi:hypothetical protein
VSFSVLCEISNGGLLLMAAGEKTGYKVGYNQLYIRC